MKKFLFTAAVVATLPFVTACTKSVDRAERDVERARSQAAQNVRQEQRELEETRRDAADRVARQERRVEAAARQGNETIIEEKRALDDARRDEIRRDTNDNTIVTPRVDDRTTLPPGQPARVDVNINRGPGGGVNVDVNRTP